MTRDELETGRAAPPRPAIHPETWPARERVVVTHEPFNAEIAPAAWHSAVTPTEQCYVRNHFAVPQIDPGAWRLHITDSTQRTRECALDELRALPVHRLTVTMECAGNDRIGFAPLTPGEPWGSGAVSTAIWRGTPLRELLAAATLDDTCVELLFCGADGGVPSGEHSATVYARSLPIDKALEADTLVAYEMNGQPIPAQHGGPVRLVVPGWYGMASVKWLERISALEQPFDGYFQRARYVLERPGAPPKPLQAMQVKAHIATPQAGECLTTGAIEISGMAWSGEGAIVRVEVRIDHTGRWNAAQLGECATAHSWQPWSWTCEACTPGRHVIQVRATDSRGNTQPEVAEWNKYGYVNNAIQTIVVTVVER